MNELTLTNYDIQQPHFNDAWIISKVTNDFVVEVLIQYGDYGYSKNEDCFFNFSELKERIKSFNTQDYSITKGLQI